MECPNCKHATSSSALLQCSHCGEAFERGPLEELQHLQYLAGWLANRPEIAQELRGQLLDLVGRKQSKLREQLLPKVVEKAKPPETKPTPVVQAKPTLEKPARATATQTKSEPVIPAAPVVKPAPISTPAPKPKAVPKPIAPPKPKRPPIDWRKVIVDAATSGALLRALLYLGAFMIVVSATVLVIRFWDQFHPVIQLLFIASVPLSFYAGGWALRIRLKLIQAGTVLTGIGALLVVVDFAAIYQLGRVGQNNGPLYWLLVSIFCTALYTFTAWRLEGEFFDYLPLLGGTGVLFTFARVLRLDLEWGVVSVTLAGTLMTLLASRYWKMEDQRRDFARAARYLSQILLPASVFYVIFAPAMPPVAQMVGFLFATVGYLLLAWQFPAFIFAYAALGASVGTVLFAMRAAEAAVEWYPTAASILALAYLLISQRVQRSKIDLNLIQKYVTALNTTGLVMLSLAAGGGFIASLGHTVWAGVIAMTLATLDLVFCAYFFQKSRYTLLASGLFIAPFSIAMIEGFDLMQIPTATGIAWLTFGWGALALAYIGLGAVLQRVEKHNRWLYAWAHILTLIALYSLPFSYLLDISHWTSGPALVSLGVCIVVYMFSFILQDSGSHSSLSVISSWLPYGLGKSIFLWPIATLLPIWAAVDWYATDLSAPWFGAALTGLGLSYLGVGQVLLRRAKEYRLPFHVLAYLLCILGILISASDLYALFAALLITVISFGVIAYLYDRVAETIIASLLFVWSFQLLLDIFEIPDYAQTLGYALLASLAYIPVGIYLNKFQKSREKFHQIPFFSVGYALMAYAVGESVLLREGNAYLPWVGTVVPLIATALFMFSAWYFRSSKLSPAWVWAGMLTFTLTVGQAVMLFEISGVYRALACACLAGFYMIAERALFFISQKLTNNYSRFWSRMFHLPAIVFALALAMLGLALSLPDTLNALVGIPPKDYLPPILAQAAVVVLSIASARLYKVRWQFFLEPFISILPATLFFIGYGEQIFGQALTTPQYALVWTGLGILHVLAAVAVDRAKIRYAHGLYLGGYVLLSLAVLWSVFEQPTLIWTLGLWILTLTASALLVHIHRHQTWDEFIRFLFGTSRGLIQTMLRNTFQWLAAWAFPIWCVIFLREMAISDNFSWLGLVIPPLAYLALALWFRRIDSTYATPLISAAQFYTIIGLLISTPATFDFLVNYIAPNDNTTLPAFILLQATTVIFYAFSAWIFKSRGFAHIAAWLSISAFSMAWQYYGIALIPINLVVPWLIWSAILLVIGYTLDKNIIRYSHGLYLAGYALMLYALARSTDARITNIYALAITILLALLSYLVLHFGRHHTFEDFVNAFLKQADETIQPIVSTLFLFFVAYALPILLVQILAYNDYPLAWRGLWLAIAALIYIGIGLLVGKAKPRTLLPLVPTWALYSAGYALTAVGVIFAWGNEQLETYVLTLNVILYTASAYIFRKAFWLYLSTVLTPIIALLILHQIDRLESAWVAWTFILLAYLYLGIGQLFDRNKKSISSDIHPFAMPFYVPGFVLSVIALALASGEKTLAIQIYSAGVILYALAGWLLRQTLFIYPAAWLAAVPYYLVITLTPLETHWYGLAWLPFIVIYIAIGRIFFHKEPFPHPGAGALIQWIKHPAIPFYLLAYVLSAGMIWLSYTDPLALTLGLSAGMVLYITSAFLFRTPAWLFAGLLAAHLALLAYFTIDPQGGEAYLLSYPFHALTWLMALFGYGLSRWIIVPGSNPAQRRAEAVEEEMHGFSWLDHLFGHPWARPFFLFVVTDIILWQFIALNSYETTIALAIGHTLLLALFSILWAEGSLVYDMVCFGSLAVGASLKQAGVPFGEAAAVFGGIGFGLYLLARGIEPISSRFKTLSVWIAPLTRCSILLTGAAVIVNLPMVERQMTATAASLAFAGALYVTIAYRERRYPLGYLGMALLEIAWAIVLYMNEIRQPQLYAIPGGLYFLGIAYLEMQLNRKRYAMAIELLGLGVLLVTSFAQSLNSETGLVYFVLLMIESLLVIWWGVLQKRKVPFFTGIGASAINIAAQVIILISVHDIHRVNRWLVAFGAGVIITAIAVIAELKREQLRARSRQLSEMLETWE